MTTVVRRRRVFWPRSERHRQIYDLIDAAGPKGMTNKELAAALDSYHGPVSGVTSELHLDGYLKVVGKVGRWHLYVTPRHVAGRETIPPRHNRGIPRYCPNCGAEVLPDEE